jgi:Na+/H+-dicarboxylate symporter/ABC-type amino acid transport substrate-binding protein
MGTKGQSNKKLSVNILIGIVLGVLTGLFLGDYAEPFSYIGDAFIGLLQMTVLPYIILSLIVNLGKLSLEEGKELILNAVKVLIFLIALGFLTILIFPLSFPEWSAGTFFSTSMIEQADTGNFLDVYIPSNPFQSMSESQVPAIVLFSIFLGIALSKTEKKEGLIGALDTLANALNQVNKMVIKLTPIGVFGIAASTAGTMSLQEIGKLQTYLLVYTVIVLIMVFWVLPMLMMTTTNVKYKALFRNTRSTLLTIFATGKIIVVLPQLIDDVNRLLLESDVLEKDSEEDSPVDLLMPLAYPFPNLGTLTIFIFVLFSGWYMGTGLTVSDYPLFVGSGLLSSFINPITGIPFMLDLFHISKDLVNLFMVSTVYTDRIRVVLGAMHLIALAVLASSMTLGKFKVKKVVMVRRIIVTVLIYIVSIIGIRTFLSYTIGEAEPKDALVMKMKNIYSSPKTTYSDKLKRNPVRLSRNETVLARVKRTHKLRVGVIKDLVPFSYINSENKLVGFDVEVAGQLAHELGVDLEFIFVKEPLHVMGNDYFDIFLGGVPLSVQIAEEFNVSGPYSEMNLALISKDDRNEFKSYNSLIKIDTFYVGVVKRLEFFDKMSMYYPKSKPVKIASQKDFFESDTLDALLTTAERGTPLTMIYNDYQLTLPFPYKVSLPQVMLIDKDDTEFTKYINTFISLKKNDGTFDHLYKYWVEGKDVERDKKHWSVIKDVLHWVE